MLGKRIGLGVLAIVGGLSLTYPAEMRNPAMVPLGICTVVPDDVQEMVFERMINLCRVGVPNPIPTTVQVDLTVEVDGVVLYSDTTTHGGPRALNYRRVIDASGWDLQAGDEIVVTLTLLHLEGPEAGAVVSDHLVMPVGEGE